MDKVYGVLLLSYLAYVFSLINRFVTPWCLVQIYFSYVHLAETNLLSI